MFKKVSGTRDILPEEAFLWQRIEGISRDIFSIYGYQECRLPLIEDAGLFNRSLGESAEIVQKQMFLIRNQQDSYALRPEGTASIARAYIENNLDKTTPFVKFFYIGPMFRLERPQKGRLRQFHHIGIEAIGSGQPEIDIETIALADNLLNNFGVKNYKIRINSLGCAQDKEKLSQKLFNALSAKKESLCPDCQKRHKTNTLRILDCKNQDCKKIVSGLKLAEACLCPECKEHFCAVLKGLDAIKINYEIDPCLVRGLDYYSRTVFEITHHNLGAQDALGAGGRYDKLIQGLGGPDIGAVGFAFGIERLLLAVPALRQERAKNLVYLISLGKEAKDAGIKLLAFLRRAGIPADTDYENKSLKGAMRLANDLNARFVLIIGENELKKNTITLKDMVSGEQKEIKQEELITSLKQC
jgi:histidyl-tRNA synthetase